MTASVNHLTCPMPPHQSVIWLAHCHHIGQSFDLPTATTSSIRASASASTRDRASASTRHRALSYHHISQSFDLPTATTSVSHLTCPLPLHYHIGQSFDLPPPPHRSVIWHAPCHLSGSHLTCPLPPHHYVPTTPSSSANTSASSSASTSSSTSSSSSTSTSARELEIIKKFLCPHHL